MLLCVAKLSGMPGLFGDEITVIQESFESPPGRPSFTICSRMLRYS